MAPLQAVEKIAHLLISTSENGVSTDKTFLDAVQAFDKYLTANNTKRPVVLIDGDGSRLIYEVLMFLRNRLIWLFISPPDTTGMTQLLNQLNKIIYQQYAITKKEMFTAFKGVGGGKILSLLFPSFLHML